MQMTLSSLASRARGGCCLEPERRQLRASQAAIAVRIEARQLRALLRLARGVGGLQRRARRHLHVQELLHRELLA